MNRYRYRHTFRSTLTWAALVIAVACGGAHDAAIVTPTGSPAAATAIDAQAATVSISFAYDATLHGAAFTDPKGAGLTYTVSFSPSSNGLSASGGMITGVPQSPGVITVKIVASDVKGESATQSFAIVAFAGGLTAPQLPATLQPYSDASVPLPAHFRVDNSVTGPAIGFDNTPTANPTTDAGATLGRVLFYDPRLSVNDQIACGSCHLQAFGFSDTARLSRGFAGGRTMRHAMGLANARFYQLGRFFWDSRAATLENQVVTPIQDQVEMGMTLDNLVTKVAVTNYYPSLFQAAFGSREVTSERISRALAQFVRSMVSSQSRFDAVFDANGTPDFTKLTPQELEGRQLFVGVGNCAACHVSNAAVSDAPHNTGLDAVITDVGSGSGQFKAPSLRNIAVRPPYMHDGRFKTLDEVVTFYDSGVNAPPGLDARLRVAGPNGTAGKKLNLTQSQRDALVAYLRTLTDPMFLSAPKFSSPFPGR